ncbi:MAG: DUF4402 domain-containing protein [Mariniphaga sp.]
MKKLVILFASLFLVVVATENVSAQVGNTDEVEATASATIIAPLTIEKDRDLAFGTLVRPQLGSGTATIIADAANSRELTNNLTALTGDFHSAQFTVTGDDSKPFGIDFPESIELSPELTITTTISGDATNVVTEDEVYVFYIGGSMEIDDDVDAGVYTTTFDVTVTYE